MIVSRRPYHAFISHAHVDRKVADEIVRWLRQVAGVPTWYDANLPPGSSIAPSLSRAIEQSRSMILLLSQESVRRGWVQQEFNAAINHQTQYPQFRIIPVRLDDVQPPGFLGNYSSIDVPDGALTMKSAFAILRGLYQPQVEVDVEGGRHVYVSRGWRTSDSVLASPVMDALRNAGLSLIGDSEDHTSWSSQRVAGIMRGVGGFVAILPFRSNEEHGTSEYVVRECQIAASLGLPSIVVADPRIDQSPGWIPDIGPVFRTDGSDPELLDEAAGYLAERWREPSQPSYIFFATSFEREDENIRREAKELIVAISGMPCVLGEYVTSTTSVQRAILKKVCEATAVIADITGDSPNVYIEAGAARVADVQLSLLRRGALGRPAFMLRDLQVWDYSSDAELAGRLAAIVYPLRRAVLDQQR
jgi:TIR domain.